MQFLYFFSVVADCRDLVRKGVPRHGTHNQEKEKEKKNTYDGHAYTADIVK